jgi:hypothetical protein
MSVPSAVNVNEWARATVDFFRVPANVLSVLAIVAVIIVPAIEKWLKSEDDLNARTASLVDATHQLIQLGDPTEDPVTASASKMQVVFAEREIQLNRATALANSIGDRTYPSVLFALAPLLCRDGRNVDADRFLQGIVKRSHAWNADRRPSRDELAQAYVGMARCMVMSAVAGKPLSKEQLLDLDDHMTQALGLYADDSGLKSQGEQANIHGEWAEMDRQLGNADAATKQQQSADALVVAVRIKFPQFPTPRRPEDKPQPLREADLPRASAGLTYKVTFPGDPDLVERVLFAADKDGPDFTNTPYLFRYYKGNFVVESSALTFSQSPGSVIVLRWTTEVPTTVDEKKKPRVAMEWIIEKSGLDHIEGIQQSVGTPPQRFVGERVPQQL